MVGEDKVYVAQEGDTFPSIGEAHSIGFVALRAANPDIAPWELKAGKEVILPGRTILPESAPHKGLVVNIGEMRIYDFTQNAAQPKYYAIGIGREAQKTPAGAYKIGAKVKNPTWRPTDRMLAEDPELKPVYPPGPDNPLGTRAMYLADTLYRIHGTNKPWGVGRRASSGCIRMYPADIEAIYDRIPVGTPVHIISEPIKVAVENGEVWLEAHPDEIMADAYENDFVTDMKVPDGTLQMITEKAGDLRGRIDWAKVRDVLLMRPGYPVKITS